VVDRQRARRRSPVIGDVFDKAERRDPEHLRTWAALVDRNNHQIDCIKAQALKRKIDVTIIIDLIHVLKYLWAAAWCFLEEGNPAGSHERALTILDGGALNVAAAIRRRTSSEGLMASDRKGADACAKYLANKATYRARLPDGARRELADRHRALSKARVGTS
jgi:hypothetical protein